MNQGRALKPKITGTVLAIRKSDGKIKTDCVDGVTRYLTHAEYEAEMEKYKNSR